MSFLDSGGKWASSAKQPEIEVMAVGATGKQRENKKPRRNGRGFSSELELPVGGIVAGCFEKEPGAAF